MLTARQIEKANDWGTTYAQDMVKRQATRLRSLTGVESYFGPSEIEINAQKSSRIEARDQRIPSSDYAQWERLFVAAYSTAYVQAVAERQQ